MSDKKVTDALWWICLLVAPLILVGIELFHPADFTEPPPGMFAYLCKAEPYSPKHWALDYPGPDWWFTLHMVQTPMIALVTVGLWRVVGDLASEGGIAVMSIAWISRAAALVFLVYYTVLDAIGGVGLGRTIVIAESLKAAGQLSQAQLDGVALVLDRLWVDPWVGGVGSFVSETGSWAVFVAAAAAAIALLLARRAGAVAVVLLVGFGWELQDSHASPHGPIAFALLIAFGIWLPLFDRKLRWPVGSGEPEPPLAVATSGGMAAK